MSGYRLYFLDPASGRFERSLELDAAEDRAAIALAEGYRGRQSLELWTDSRKICRIAGAYDWPSVRAAR